MPSTIEFLSDGFKIKGHLYRPLGAGTGKYPALVVCHGFAGVKELLLPRFAEAFAAAGFVALTFDYRGFGESEGRGPRIVPGEQASDIRNAMTFLATLPDVDPLRLGLWGTSYGGANVITVAACDPRVKAACVQITFADGHQSVFGGMTPEQMAEFMASLDKIWARAVTSGKELMLPLPKMLTDGQSKAFYEKYRAACPALDVKLPFLTVKETLSQRPICFMPRVTAPVHFTLAANDAVNPPEGMRALYRAATCEKQLLEIPDAGHYDLYEDPCFGAVVEAQVKWFSKWLS